MPTRRAANPPYLECPECGSRCKIRTSSKLTPKTREIYGDCTNLSCAKTSVFMLEWSRYYFPRPPKNPKARVEIAGS